MQAARRRAGFDVPSRLGRRAEAGPRQVLRRVRPRRRPDYYLRMAHSLTWDDLELGDALGTGQSGTVFKARLRTGAYDLKPGSYVAVKIYKTWVTEEPGFVERLFREVSVGRAVTNRHVLRIHGAILSRDGRPALVMALHQGMTLEQELKRRREQDQPFSFDSGIQVLNEAATGLIALHSIGIVHRDIKPANILLGTSGTIVADFGVVKSSSMPEQTTTGAFLGTIRYAAPEYLFGQPYDPDCDVYSFGCLAYEIFTNGQTFGERQHWADLVLVKRFEKPNLSASVLEQMTERYGVLKTDFARLVIEATVGAERGNRLALTSFVRAVNERVWRSSLLWATHDFRRGPFTHHDSFETAANAAEKLRMVLRPHEFAALRSLLRKSYWQDELAYQHNKFNRKLRRMGVFINGRGRDDRWWSLCQIAPSIREAFALGLLDDRQQSLLPAPDFVIT